MTYTIIRYEGDDTNLVAVCENQDGDRWYMPIIVDGEVSF